MTDFQEEFREFVGGHAKAVAIACEALRGQ
jgi:hypothetical protein